MGVFTLTVVRHGETQANKDHVIQGQQDTHLSEKGIQQAQLAGIRLQQDGFTHVFSSDLSRAHRTCEAILEKNTVCNCPIIKDPRLRERKFGTFEGKPSAEFHAAAKNRHKHCTEVFPPGGETSKELRARAREFFNELCQNLIKEFEIQNGNANGQAKRRRHTGGGCSDVFPVTDGTGNSDSGGLTFNIGENKLSPTAAKDSGHSSSGSTSSTSGCESLTTGSSLEQLSEQTVAEQTGSDQFQVDHTSDISPSQESSCSSLDDSPSDPAVCLVYDSEIQNAILPSKSIQYGCPNVSLSPIFEHRLSSISSVSSGRNNSFDDGDTVPFLFAEVLVVSHGGLIQQLINFFIEELGCKIPGSKKHAMRAVTPNAGLSKFSVTLEPGQEYPTMTCLYIHDSNHLVGQDVEAIQRREEA